LFFFFTLVTGPRRSLSLELSNTRVYEPQIRARLVTTAHFCAGLAQQAAGGTHPARPRSRASPPPRSAGQGHLASSLQFNTDIYIYKNEYIYICIYICIYIYIYYYITRGASARAGLAQQAAGGAQPAQRARTRVPAPRRAARDDMSSPQV